MELRENAEVDRKGKRNYNHSVMPCFRPIHLPGRKGYMRKACFIAAVCVLTGLTVFSDERPAGSGPESGSVPFIFFAERKEIYG